MRNFILIFILFISVFNGSALIYPQVTSLSTQNVFVFNIDGIRYNEAFGAGNTFLRYIHDSIKPKCTTYINFYNTGVTVTNAAHSTIVTGVRQTLPNNVGIPTLIRPYEPTVGEYYRKYSSVPKNKVVFISGKNTIWEYPVSMYPGFGEAYEPTMLLTNEYDTTTYSDALRIINENHPKLCYVLFAQVDVAGHTGDSSKYFGAIRQVDSLIFKLYKKITSDSVYADNTTIIITTDHGRHDDQHGGWRHHGDHCRGCRHVLFLASGPDIKVNTEISAFRDQTDITPTIGYLLGFPVPLAEGSLLTEMLAASREDKFILKKNTQDMQNDSVKNLSGSAGSSRNSISRSCSITQYGSSYHVVFSDNSSGSYSVYYTKSTDSGENWTSPALLFPASNSSEAEPVITQLTEDILFSTVTGFRYSEYDSSYIWALKGRLSTNSGNSWNQELIIDTLLTIGRKHSVSLYGTNLNILAQRFDNIQSYLSRDSCSSFRIRPGNSPLYTDFFTGTLIDTIVYAAWQTLKQTISPYWNIYYRIIPSSMIPYQLTYNSTHSYSYLPSISSSQGVLHLVYQTLSNSHYGNNWKLIYKRNNLSDNQWSSSVEPAPGRVIHYPKIKSVPSQQKVYAVWSDYTSGGWSIYGCRSTNSGQSWLPPEKLTPDYQFLVYPDFTVNNDTIGLCWQGYENGKWDIFFAKRFTGNITSEPNKPHGPEEFILRQNFPNPFNPVTRIEFSVPRKLLVCLKVFDILGKEIQTLVNEVKESGNYSVLFDGNSLSSGVYFYKIESTDFTESKKMFLIK